jgi:hypothetical protein
MATELGKEVSCTRSLRTGQYVTGTRLVAEAIFRRLITPRGTLRGGEEESNYGLDLASLIGSVRAKSDIAALPAQIEAEIRKDDRVESVSVSVLETTEPNKLRSFTISFAVTTGAGPFTLVVGASAVTVELLGIKAEA